MTAGLVSGLDAVPRTAQGHFRLHAYAAILRLIGRLQRLLDPTGESLDPVFRRFPFLAGYFEELRRLLPGHGTWEQATAWWQAQIAAWETGCREPLPLRTLVTDGGVSPTGLLALLLTGLVEDDSRFASLFAELQPSLQHHRPSVELVGRLVGEDPMTSGEDAWSLCQPLLAAGFLDAANRDLPRSEWELSVPGVLWDVMRGDVRTAAAPWCRHRPAAALPRLADLLLPDDLQARLAQVPAVLGSGKARTLVVRGMQGSERLEVVGAVARVLGCGLIEVEAQALESEEARAHLGPLCTLTGSLPVVICDLGPGETAALPALSGYRGPVAAVLGLEGGLRGDLAARAVTLQLPLPGPALRLRHWQQALAGHPCADLVEVSSRFQIPGGHIRQAAALAIARAALEQRESVEISDVREACRWLGRQALDTLAVRLEARGTWEQLVVSDAVAAKLRELERRCRHRERLLEHLGPAYTAGANRGVRALFSGPSGTGKTLAARILAAELEMDIYRVDLAAVVNKYIGETEKNLHQVLSRAEELDVILLLDEGDALLAKRSDVTSANDRYANLETNYLLQRLEAYQGIVLVTTNASDFIDKAFQRRMDVAVDFLPPRAEERLRIWQLHLPPGHAVDAEFLEEVAVRCALTGGQIRGAALHATLLALDRGGRVGRSEVAAGLQSEYRKAGGICPLDDPGPGSP